jgi:hypothetical protein
MTQQGAIYVPYPKWFLYAFIAVSFLGFSSNLVLSNLSFGLSFGMAEYLVMVRNIITPGWIFGFVVYTAAAISILLSQGLMLDIFLPCLVASLIFSYTVLDKIARGHRSK